MLKDIAKRAIGLLDLTSLNDNDTDDVIKKLCAKAHGSFGHTAAVCVWPRFVKLARKELAGKDVRIATVVNFPAGGTDIASVVKETEGAIEDGADEIDVVFPYKALMDGNKTVGADLVKAVKKVCGKNILLKVIIESGVLQKTSLIVEASKISIANGADFIKTSTGKTPVSATIEAANAMIETIRDSGKPVGFKGSGGVRTTEQARDYMAIADAIMGKEWISPKTFRFGASGLLDDLLKNLGLGSGSSSNAKGY